MLFRSGSTDEQNVFKADLKKRSVIEGRIGTSKRKYGLDQIFTKLVSTSRCVIGMALFAMNAEKILRLTYYVNSLISSVSMPSNKRCNLSKKTDQLALI